MTKEEYEMHSREILKQGISINEYCKCNGLSSSQFYNWNSRSRKKESKLHIVHVTPNEEETLNQKIKINFSNCSCELNVNNADELLTILKVIKNV